MRISARKFFKRETWHFGDDVINGRLETGRGHFRDIIVDFIQHISNRQLGGDLGDGKARRL